MKFFVLKQISESEHLLRSDKKSIWKKSLMLYNVSKYMGGRWVFKNKTIVQVAEEGCQSYLKGS